MWKRFVALLVFCLVLAACASSEEKGEAVYERALGYYENGEIPEARIEAKNAIKLNPKLGKAYLLLGDCAVKEQNWRGAFGAYSQAVQLNPELIDAQLGVGRIYLLSRQYDKAQEIVRIVVEKEPNNTDAHLLKAGVLLQSGSLDGAQRVLQAILSETPDNTDAILGLITTYEKKGQADLAKAVLEKALAKNPDSIVLYYKAASLAETEERYADAEGFYAKLLELSEKKNSVRLLIVKLHEKAGQTDKAEQELKKLVHDEPEELDYSMALVGLYLRSKQYDKGLVVVSKYLDAKPDDIKMKLAQVEILLAKDEIDTGKEQLLAISEQHSDHPLSATVLSKLGALYLKEKDYTKSLEILEEAVQRNASPEIIQIRARAKLAAGDLEGAIADLRIVRKELPDNYEARYLLARAYLAQDKGLMAVEELHDILERNADYSPSRNLLVKYYARYGQWQLAEEELAKLLQQTPEDPALLIAMGDVKRMQGDKEAAKKMYRAVLSLQDGHAPALLRLGMIAESENRLKDALGLYEQVLAAHPKSAAAIERKLFTLALLGNAKGLASFQGQLLSTMPDSPVLYDIFGRLALGRGDYDGAEREFRKASEMAPDWGVPYQRLIGIYLMNDNLDKVVAECKAVLGKNPQAFLEEFLLGQIYQMRGDVEAAQLAYEATLRKRSNFLPAANNLAYLYAENSDDPEKLNKALVLAKMASEKGTPEALDTLGWIYHLMGNREQSIDALNKAYEGAPTNKTIAYHLAFVLAKWSHTSEAKRIVEDALADGSAFPERAEMESLLKTL